MLGTLIGDIVGSRFEKNNIKKKEFELWDDTCRPTDDSIMTLAVARAILRCDGRYEQLGELAAEEMRTLGRRYPDCGFGWMFFRWIFSDDMKGYGSYGNGAAMRVSACAYAARDIEEAKALSRAVTEVTHGHPEGICGAEAVTTAIFMALHGSDSAEIRREIGRNYYALDFTLDEIRENYVFNATCQGSVPQAIEAALEAESFEDAIRNAISIGGDSDTLAAIAGGIAEAYYGVPDELRRRAEEYLDGELKGILHDFECRFGRKKQS